MQKYRFSEFELDLDAFELRLRGEPVKLERRPLDLLVLLVRQPGRMVPREEIVASLWPPNVIIDFDSGLNTLVRKVRNALGDSSEEPKFIETVPGRGYRFVAPVTPHLATPQPEPATPVPPASIEVPSVRSRRSTRALGSLVLLLALVAGALAWFIIGTERERAPVRIAVLPFENLTGDDELAYLASGLAEDTSTSLAQIDPTNLRVIGVSARPAANPALSVAEVGNAFGVDYVVMSSLRLDRSRIRVTSRLLRVMDGEQVWSASIDREFTNVLGLQRELSIAIAEQVRLSLSPEVAAAIDRRQTQNPKAYALYLKGRYEWVQLTPASMRRSLEYFEQATAEDPNYALAWAGLAFAAITSTRTADVAPATVTPIARNALQRALELGPDLVETRYAQGYYHMFLELDRHTAAREARAAIALDPNNAQAHMLLAMALLRDNNVEAREMMRRSRELDPMFALAFANSANVALAGGDADEALELSKQTVAINPEFWLGYYYLGRAKFELGDFDGALEAYADAARLSGGHSIVYASRAGLLVQLGRIEETQALVAVMKARAETQHVPAYTFAVIHALLGETDEAFAWLDRAVESRDLGLPGLLTDARLRVLRGDPRFEDVVRRCGCIQEVSPEDSPGALPLR
jgi:TolB-like protein/DNA-binding winged helix-turn-helix (wHTH) protein/cytochrome c-type biogenesis protein CcmH/NrfG